MMIYSPVSKTYFYKKGFALSLALKLRVTVELGNGLLYALLITKSPFQEKQRKEKIKKEMKRKNTQGMQKLREKNC